MPPGFATAAWVRVLLRVSVREGGGGRKGRGREAGGGAGEREIRDGGEQGRKKERRNAAGERGECRGREEGVQRLVMLNGPLNGPNSNSDITFTTRTGAKAVCHRYINSCCKSDATLTLQLSLVFKTWLTYRKQETS